MPAGSAVTVAAHSVSRWFGSVVAVADVSVAIGPGVTALLGPNGAGKTTLVRMLCGLVRPSAGRALVDGRDPRRDVAAAATIGYVGEPAGLLEPLTARQFVRSAGVLHGLAEPGPAAERALAAVDLDPSDPRPLRAYSKGMRQRATIAQALVHQPAVLVLDEPLTGLDPAQRRRLAGLFRQLGDDGHTVLVSSHVLAEVEPLADRLVVLLGGRVVAEGELAAIRALMDDRTHRLRVATDAPAALAAALVRAGQADGVRLIGDNALEVETGEIGAFRAGIASVAASENARLREVVPLDDDLESVFRYAIERGRGAQGGAW
jgi:ABC-2 type transport system ATP-binding protein